MCKVHYRGRPSAEGHTVFRDRKSLDFYCEALHNENLKPRLSLHMQTVLSEFKKKLEFIQITCIKMGLFEYSLCSLKQCYIDTASIVIDSFSPECWNCIF